MGTFTDSPDPVARLKKAARREAAKQLEDLGWALVRYGKRVQRACEKPSSENEASAAIWHAETKARMRMFVMLRDAWRSITM